MKAAGWCFFLSSMMISSNLCDAIIYYIFHFLYLGHPSDILARLWLAHDIADGNIEMLGENQAHQAWRVFDDSMRESYKAIGTLAGLLAGALSGLSSIDQYRVDTAIRTLLLAGITASVISASSCLSMLSTVYLDPVNIEHHWKSSGIIYVIALSGPSAWLTIALWIFQAAILAIVWLKESTPARVVVTFFIGLRVCFRVAGQFHATASVNSRSSDFILGLLGRRQGMDHYMVNLNQHTIKRRKEYLRALGKIIEKGSQGSHERAMRKSESTAMTQSDHPIPKSVFADIERANFFRGLEEPTIEDLNP